MGTGLHGQGNLCAMDVPSALGGCEQGAPRGSPFPRRRLTFL